MAITRMTMTDEQRKSVALEYLKAFDNKGVTSNGGSILDLFADDAQVFFPKWGLATGKAQIGQLFTDFAGSVRHILHDYATFNWVMTGTDVFACEGTSAGGTRRRASGGPGSAHAGRWCDVFEVRDFLIQRCFIYLDPDYAGRDTQRYPWLSANGRDPVEADGLSALAGRSAPRLAEASGRARRSPAGPAARRRATASRSSVGTRRLGVHEQDGQRASRATSWPVCRPPRACPRAAAAPDHDQVGGFFDGELEDLVARRALRHDLLHRPVPARPRSRRASTSSSHAGCRRASRCASKS